MRPNGIRVSRIRVPIGVIAMVYESRPNVTVEASALTLKAGNAVVLRGSSTAERSNAVLARIVAESGEAVGLPEGSVQLLAGGDRSDLVELVRQERLVDLVIPRGRTDRTGGGPQSRSVARVSRPVARIGNTCATTAGTHTPAGRATDVH